MAASPGNRPEPDTRKPLYGRPPSELEQLLAALDKPPAPYRGRESPLAQALANVGGPPGRYSAPDSPLAQALANIGSAARTQTEPPGRLDPDTGLPPVRKLRRRRAQGPLRSLSELRSEQRADVLDAATTESRDELAEAIRSLDNTLRVQRQRDQIDRTVGHLNRTLGIDAIEDSAAEAVRSLLPLMKDQLAVSQADAERQRLRDELADQREAERDRKEAERDTRNRRLTIGGLGLAALAFAGWDRVHRWGDWLLGQVF